MVVLNAKKILVPVSGSESDMEAFRLACSLARENRAKLYAVYVIEVGRDLPVDADLGPETRRGEEVLSRIEAIAREKRCGLEADILQARESGAAILQEAVDKDVDLIIIGAPYKRRPGSSVLHDTINYLLKNSPCPVLVLREGMPVQVAS